MVTELESKLTPAEKRDREIAFEQLRQFIRNVQRKGTGLPIVKQFLSVTELIRGIRVDLEVLKGRAAVPDHKDALRCIFSEIS